MCQIRDVIPDKDTIIHLLPDIDQRNQNKGQRDFFLPQYLLKMRVI